MRDRDLFGFAILLSIGLVFGGTYILPLVGFRIGFLASLGSPAIASFIIAPFLLVLLFPLNQRFRQWRKAHGRDIAEEERYETEYGMTRLTPNDNQSIEQNDLEG